MNVELTDEGIKLALKDRFRVIDLSLSHLKVQELLNEHGDNGFGILYLTKKMIIMTRVVNLNVNSSAALPEGWSVPGAQGTDGNA